jgi:hypothetical protein
MGDLPVTRPLHTQNNANRINAYRQVGFEPMTPASERAKIVHALDGVTTVIGSLSINLNM